MSLRVTLPETDQKAVPVACPMGQSDMVTHGHSGSSKMRGDLRFGKSGPPAALIPKLMVRQVSSRARAG